MVEQQDRATRPGEVAVEAVVDVRCLADQDQCVFASSSRGQGERPSAEDLEPEPVVVGVQQRFGAVQGVVDAPRHREDRGPVSFQRLHRPGLAEEVRGLVEHGERGVRVGHGVEAVRGAPTDDPDPVGLGQLAEVDARENRFESLGFVAPEVELGEQLHRPRPAAGVRCTAHESLRDGVVSFEQGQACRVQHVLPVDRAPGVEPPGHEPNPIVTAAGADRFEGVGELATQAPPPERRQLAQEDLLEQRVGERHPGPPPRIADGEQPMPLQILEHGMAHDGCDGLEPDLACDREQLGRVMVGVVQAPETLGDEILERGGRLEGADEPPHAVELGQDICLERGLDELAQHARVPGGSVPEAVE